MAFLRRRSAPSDAVPSTDADPAEAPSLGPTSPQATGTAATDLAPSRMRGSEALYGYVVGLELLVVAILHLVVRTGKGAPAHPNTALQVLGIVAAVAFFGVLQVRSRTIVGFAAIVAAFFVTLPKVPNSLAITNVFTLAIPLAYGLILTQRQRRAIGTTMRGARRGGRGGRGAAGQDGATTGGRAGGRAGGRTTGAGARADRRGRGRSPAATPSGPRPNARYTPPKSKRARGRR